MSTYIKNSPKLRSKNRHRALIGMLQMLLAAALLSGAIAAIANCNISKEFYYYYKWKYADNTMYKAEYFKEIVKANPAPGRQSWYIRQRLLEIAGCTETEELEIYIKMGYGKECAEAVTKHFGFDKKTYAPEWFEFMQNMDPVFIKSNVENSLHILDHCGKDGVPILARLLLSKQDDICFTVGHILCNPDKDICPAREIIHAHLVEYHDEFVKNKTSQRNRTRTNKNQIFLQYAIQIAGRTGISNKKLIPLLKDFLKHHDSGIIYLTIEALGSIGPAAQDTITEIIDSHVDLYNKCEITNLSSWLLVTEKTLKKIGPSGLANIKKSYFKYLNDKRQSEYVRIMLVNILAGMGEPARETIKRLLEHRNNKVRLEMVEALARTKFPNKSDLLSPLTYDTDSRVQRHAVFAFLDKDMKSPGKDFIKYAMKNNDSRIRFAAAFILSEKKTDYSLEMLLELLKDESKNVWFCALMGIEKINPPFEQIELKLTKILSRANGIKKHSIETTVMQLKKSPHQQTEGTKAKSD